MQEEDLQGYVEKIGIASDKPSIYTQSTVTSIRTSLMTRGDPIELKKM